MIPGPARSALSPYTTLVGSIWSACWRGARAGWWRTGTRRKADRKSTRLNSSHLGISYAVFCLKKKGSTLPLPPFGNRKPGTRQASALFDARIVRCAYYNRYAFFFFNDTATTEIYTLSLHDALPI